MAEKRAKTARPRKAVAKKSAAKKPAAKKSSRPPAKKVAKTAAKKVASIAAHRPKPKPQPANDVVTVIETALDDIKAVNVRILDVRKLTDIADTLVIASGNSDRHVRSIADRVVEFAKKAGFRPMGVEGERDGEWVLVDLQDVIVHIMLPRVREFYRLESLWDVSAARREAAAAAAGE
jgi:ribosome silencing factor RsfS/YbeB/iojap